MRHSCATVSTTMCDGTAVCRLVYIELILMLSVLRRNLGAANLPIAWHGLGVSYAEQSSFPGPYDMAMVASVAEGVKE